MSIPLYPIAADDLSVAQHRAINALLTDNCDGETWTSFSRFKDLKGAAALLAAKNEDAARMLMILLDHGAWHRARCQQQYDIYLHIVESGIDAMLAHKIPLQEDQVLRILEWGIAGDLSGRTRCTSAFIKTAMRCVSEHPTAQVQALAEQIMEGWRASHTKLVRKAAIDLAEIMGQAPPLPVSAGEEWSDALVADHAGFDAATRKQWYDLLIFCSSADGGKPSRAWCAEAAAHLGEQGLSHADFSACCCRWFALVDRPSSSPRSKPPYGHPIHPLEIRDEHQDVLKGLVWLSTLVDDPALQRSVGALAVSCYNKKIPGVGPRAPRIGNACVWALGQAAGLKGIQGLAYLKVRVRFGTAQRQIAKALAAKAEEQGMSVDELEELSVPDHGFTAIGRAEIPLGSFTALLTVTAPATITLTWRSEQGKVQKSVPAAIKAEHAEDLKELRGSIKDLQQMLPVLRSRLDKLFLQQRSWSYADWRERYVDHPVVGFLARRLLWVLHSTVATTVSCHDGTPQTLDGKAVAVDEATTVSIWHPIGHTTQEIVAWRQRLAELAVVQPFKHAHREIYLLTDAERATRTYSNRYAAHVIRQHQFNALCASRGWKNTLRLMVDDSYPPASRELDGWGLRAEFWIEGMGQEYALDTNDSGVFTYLATDQVRFYPSGAPRNSAEAMGGGYAANPYADSSDREPLPLAEVPALVLSEIMRDVDLFVGVCSIGNDPLWMDGGEAVRHGAYWQSYNTAALSEASKNRKLILEGLIPRMKIAERCRFDDRHLLVRGDLRSYKIHLGSGNILMEPNDQYLCIVAKQSVKASDQIMLPFEGDNMLSIILSKALLLAEDRKVTDPTILSQLKT